MRRSRAARLTFVLGIVFALGAQAVQSAELADQAKPFHGELVLKFSPVPQFFYLYEASQRGTPIPTVARLVRIEGTGSHLGKADGTWSWTIHAANVTADQSFLRSQGSQPLLSLQQDGDPWGQPTYQKVSFGPLTGKNTKAAAQERSRFARTVTTGMIVLPRAPVRMGSPVLSHQVSVTTRLNKMTGVEIEQALPPAVAVGTMHYLGRKVLVARSAGLVAARRSEATGQVYMVTTDLIDLSTGLPLLKDISADGFVEASEFFSGEIKFRLVTQITLPNMPKPKPLLN